MASLNATNTLPSAKAATELSPTGIASTASQESVTSASCSESRSEGAASFVHSDSSTLIYGHEPFDQFSLRVKDLCHMIWDSPKQALIERLYRSQIGGILHVKNVFSSLRLSSPNDFEVERLAGGGFNRIIGITVLNKKTTPTRRLILRVPRFEDARPEREVAALRFIRQHTSIPVAEIEAVDFTTNNPLKKPYVIQKRVSGHDLQACIQDLDQEQLCVLTKELGGILIALQSVKNPAPGVIEATYDEGWSRFCVRPFELKTPFGIVQEPREGQEVTSSQQQTTLGFFRVQLGRWKAADAQYGEHKVHLWDCLIAAAGQIDQAGFFDDDDNCLSHLDFQARNIMVDVKTKSTLSVSGVLDWDSAIFAPKFVSCAPPWWIWADEDNEDDEDDESKANNPPRSETGQELKRFFEDTVGQDFLRYAYEPQYRLARTLFKIAMHGIRSNEYFRLAETFLEEWAKLYDSIVPEQERIVQGALDPATSQASESKTE